MTQPDVIQSQEGLKQIKLVQSELNPVCASERVSRLALPGSTRVCPAASAVRSYDYVLEPSPVALPLLQPLQTRVLQVACGRAHSLVLTDQEGGERLRPDQHRTGSRRRTR